MLPNGDILVAEGRGGGEPTLTPKDVIADYHQGEGNKPRQGRQPPHPAARPDGDGTYEARTVFADNLNAPYGLALVGNHLYVANQDALVRFDYQDGQTRASGPPVKVTDLPSAINHHWTKALAASADGRFLYVGIGSNSNITERGMAAEVDRARCGRSTRRPGAHRPFATGLRNPDRARDPARDGPALGGGERARRDRPEPGAGLSDRRCSEGGFYGWPYSYWGQNVDTRVQPQDPEKVASAIRPDYSLGSHVAALGVAFSTPAMGARFADGVFVGEHGSWNRSVPVRLQGGLRAVPRRPPGRSADRFRHRLHGDDGKTRGRPVGVTRRPARRADRRRRPVQHDLASHSCDEPSGGLTRRCRERPARRSRDRRSRHSRAGAYQEATAQAQTTAPMVSTP